MNIKKIINDKNKKLANTLYLLLCGLLAKGTNRIEIDGKPLNTLEIACFANFKRREIQIAMRDLYRQNILLHVSLFGCDYYYINPEYATIDEEEDVEDWLVKMFQDVKNVRSGEWQTKKFLTGEELPVVYS